MSQLDKSLNEVNESVNTSNKKGFWRTLLAFLGPAYLISVGYMDPGNWATDIAGGSKFGYQLIWVLLMSNLMALLLQSLAARLGIVKGWDLAQASRQQYPQWANISLYALAEIAIIACDLAEIIGMAIGLKLLFNIPLMWGIVITALDTFLLLFLLNKGVRKLEAFILVLVAIIGVSFLLEMLIIKPDLGQVVKGVIPSSLSDGALYIAIGIIGATVMPHNLYLHSALVQTRKFKRDDDGIKKAIKFNMIDSTIALNLAFFVNAAILILAGTAFYNQGLHHVSDIQDAHLLLQNIFGSLAPTLFAIALIAAGQSSTITGTLAGQIVMEGYLNLRISPWIRRLVTRLLAIAPALLTIYLFGEESMGDLLILSQVILSMQLGFAVIPLIHFNSSEKLMGKFKISNKVKVAAWVIAATIVSLNLTLVREELLSFLDYLGEGNLFFKLLVFCMLLYALFLMAYITFEPLINTQKSEKQSLPHSSEVHIGEFKTPTYRHIAVTLDFTTNDEVTINTALAMGGTQAQYLFIHIVESAGAISMGDDIIDSETKKDFEILKRYQAQVSKRGFHVDIELGYGKSAKAIINIVNQKECDLVVMAAHGHQGFKDFIFGSTVDSVRHGVKAPVFIVKK